MEYFETLRGRPIYNLQTFLRGLSKNDERIYPVVPDGIFNDDTRRSVESFQLAYNMEVTGEVDSETWEAIVNEYEKYEALLAPVNGLRIIRNDEIIQKGDNHEGLYVIQAMITSVSDKFSNIQAISITGVYDDETDNAVNNLKIIFGISDNDITKDFINKLVDLYEHTVVFKDDFYSSVDKNMAETNPDALQTNRTQEPETSENITENEQSDDVIVWKFF